MKVKLDRKEIEEIIARGDAKINYLLKKEIEKLEAKIHDLEIENHILKDMKVEKEYIPYPCPCPQPHITPWYDNDWTVTYSPIEMLYPNNGTPIVWEGTNT